MSKSYMITNRQDVNGTSSDNTNPLPDGQSFEMEVDDKANVEAQAAVRAKNASLLPMPRRSI